jgi:hypothetical protein
VSPVRTEEEARADLVDGGQHYNGLRGRLRPVFVRRNPSTKDGYAEGGIGIAKLLQAVSYKLGLPRRGARQTTRQVSRSLRGFVNDDASIDHEGNSSACARSACREREQPNIDQRRLTARGRKAENARPVSLEQLLAQTLLPRERLIAVALAEKLLKVADGEIHAAPPLVGRQRP